MDGSKVVTDGFTVFSTEMWKGVWRPDMGLVRQNFSGNDAPKLVQECRYSGGPWSSTAIFSNRVERLMKASFTRPVGPLRCLAMMISARPSNSGSSGL